jgi:glycosyltransferase involved in cell wall biosynthesis
VKIAIDARLILPHPTGIGRVTINLIEALTRLEPGHEYIAISRDGELPQVRVPESLTHIKAPFGYMSHRVHTDLPGLIRRSGTSLVHFQFYVTPLVCPVPSVVTVHDTIYSRYPEILPKWRQALYRLFMKRSMDQARYVICPSQSTADDIRRFFPSVEQSKLKVVYNGVETRFEPPDVADREKAKAALGLPESYVMYLGNHRKHKNLGRLIRAFSKVAGDVPHMLVMPPAEGKGSDETLQAISECGIAGRVAFHKMPDESLPLFYGLADAFVFPSLYEGFGLPPLEAMASGTPVVCSDSSSLPEVVGDAALLVDPMDTEHIASAIRGVLTDTELAETMRSRGLERARSFSWERTARQTLDAYHQALGLSAH